MTKKNAKKKAKGKDKILGIVEEKRLSALKKTLEELQDRRKKLPPEADDTTLRQAICELTSIIKLGPRYRTTWSPILPGSYGSGKRR